MDRFIHDGLELYQKSAGVRLDANETAFLERELTQVRSKTFETMFGAVKALSFFPLATDVAASADTYTYKVYTDYGEAKIGARGTDNPPRVGVTAKEVTGKVYPIDAAYGWDINEIAEAMRVGVPLSQRLSMAARRVIARGIDQMVFNGRPASGASSNLVTTGAANAADVTVHGSDFTHWVLGTTTYDTIIDEFLATHDAQTLACKDNEDLMSDRCLMPTNRYNVMKSTKVGVDSSLTVLKYLELNTNLKIDPWYKLTGAGASSKDRAVFYKYAPDVAEAVAPVIFEQLSPQARNYEFEVPCFGRAGGTKVYQPVGFRYRDFAAS